MLIQKVINYIHMRVLKKMFHQKKKNNRKFHERRLSFPKIYSHGNDSMRFSPRGTQKYVLCAAKKAFIVHRFTIRSQFKHRKYHRIPTNQPTNHIQFVYSIQIHSINYTRRLPTYTETICIHTLHTFNECQAND